MADDTTTPTAPVPIELKTFGITLNSPSTVSDQAIDALYGRLTPDYRTFADNIQRVGQEFKRLKELKIIPEDMSLSALYDKIKNIGSDANAKADPVAQKILENAKEVPVLGSLVTMANVSASTAGAGANVLGTAYDTVALPVRLAGAAMRDFGKLWGMAGDAGMDDGQARRFAVIFAAAQQDIYQPLIDAYQALPGGATPFSDWTPFDGKDSRFESHITAHVGAAIKHGWHTILAWPGISHIAAAVMATWQLISGYFSGNKVSWGTAFDAAMQTLGTNARTVGSVQSLADASVTEDLALQARREAAGKIRDFFGKDSPEADVAEANANGNEMETRMGAGTTGPDGKLRAGETPLPQSTGSDMVDMVRDFGVSAWDTAKTYPLTTVGGLALGGAIARKVYPPALAVAAVPFRGTGRMITAGLGGFVSGAVDGTARMAEARGFVLSNDATRASDLQQELDRQEALHKQATAERDAAIKARDDARQNLATEEAKYANRTPTPQEEKALSKVRQETSKLETNAARLETKTESLRREIHEPKPGRLGGPAEPSLAQRAADARAKAGPVSTTVDTLRADARAIEARAGRIANTSSSFMSRGAGAVGRFVGKYTPASVAGYTVYELGSGAYRLLDNDPTNDRAATRDLVSGGTTTAATGLGALAATRFAIAGKRFGGARGALVGGAIGLVVDWFAGDKITDTLTGGNPDDPKVQERELMAEAARRAEAARQAQARVAVLERREVSSLSRVELQNVRTAAGSAMITGGETLPTGSSPQASTPPSKGDVAAALFGY